MTDDFKFEIPPETKERTERLRAYFVKRFMEGLGSDWKQALMEKVQAMADEEARKEDLIRSLQASVVNLSAQNTRLRSLIEDLCRQFASNVEDPPGLWTAGMSVLEEAFEVLGWEDPNPVPDMGCDEPGCGRMATCGWAVEGGKYRRTCGLHYRPKENP